jgi:hypothetical protein
MSVPSNYNGGGGNKGSSFYPSIFKIEIKSNDTKVDSNNKTIGDTSPDYELRIQGCNISNINGG